MIQFHSILSLITPVLVKLAGMPFFTALLVLQFETGTKPKLPDEISKESYLMPPPEIASYFDQPRHLNYTLSNLNATKKWFARVKSNGGTKLSDIATPYENFAGIMIDTRANRARTLSYRNATAIVLTDATNFTEREISAPEGYWLSGSTWSPNGKFLMFLVHNPDQTTVWVHDVDRNATKQLTSEPVLASRVSPEWISDSSSVIGVFVPEKRGPEPKTGPVASQPKVQVTDSGKNRLRTYRSLLQNEIDQKRFEYFFTGQLAKVSVDSGRVNNIGKPAMISGINASPKGDYVRVATIQKPFSYIVPASNFGSKEEIWDANGKSLFTLTDVKLRSGEPAPDPVPTTGTAPAAAPQTGATADARRQLSWMPDGSGLYFIRTKPKPAIPASATPPSTTPPAGQESNDQNNNEQGRAGRGAVGANQAPATREPEELVKWVAPFRKEDEKVLLTREQGFNGLQFNQDATAIYLSETKSGETTFKRIDLNKEATETVLWTLKSTEPNPGSVVLEPNVFGIPTINETSTKLLLRGSTAAGIVPDANSRAFLNSYDRATKKIESVWKADDKAYETLDGVLDNNGTRLVINRQTATEVPNNFLVESGKKGKQLTQNKDYSPDLTEAKRYRFQVTRADGFKFWVKVTAPKWHVEGFKLPAFFWFYPNEVESQDAYDRGIRGANPNLFPNQGTSPKSLLIRRGWVLVEPDCPIVGPRTRVNDFYINDLRNNMSAVIDALDARGIADRTKLAAGGHSYGGFSTANVMVHTPFFKAGIAGAGNYNRTLTPIAFQGENRTLFEARSTYLDMSPILYAENLSGALLMYAGMEDQNVGTDPINSIRMFNVLESIGKPAALYMYPYEDHGQIARETLMDQWARWIAWLDKYVLGEPK